MLSEQQDLLYMIDQASYRARQLSVPVLVSQCQRITDRDPLFFFEKGARTFAGERMYWSAPADDMAMAGLGTVHIFKKDSGNDYQSVESGWKKLVQNGLLDVEASLPGTGPTLIGGFSFDPLQAKSGLWRQFPDTMLMLPKFLITQVNGQTWLTINRIIQPDADADQERKHLQKEHEELLADMDHPVPSSTEAPSSITHMSEPYAQEWQHAVTQMTRDIHQGEVQKVVLARELRLFWDAPVSPGTVVSRLREEQSACYVFAVEAGDQCFVGASPERLAKRDRKQLYSACMAGSIPRGKTADEDVRLGEELLADEKNREEHQIVVDMIKQAVGKVCTQVDTPSSPRLFKVKDIQHLYTPVQGLLPEQVSLLSVVEQLSPTPALGGYPRDKALERIRQLEKLHRGWYAGPIGWVDYRGDGEFAVAIRSALLQGDHASLFAGCGIVEDSRPSHEYEETRVKFRPMLSALGVLDA